MSEAPKGGEWEFEYQQQDTDDLYWVREEGEEEEDCGLDGCNCPIHGFFPDEIDCPRC